MRKNQTIIPKVTRRRSIRIKLLKHHGVRGGCRSTKVHCITEQVKEILLQRSLPDITQNRRKISTQTQKKKDERMKETHPTETLM
jgi:hypothetical protein